MMCQWKIKVNKKKKKKKNPNDVITMLICCYRVTLTLVRRQFGLTHLSLASYKWDIGKE